MIFNFDEPGWALAYSGDPSQAVIGSAYGFHSAPNALCLGDTVNYVAGSLYGLLVIEPLPIGSHVIRVWVNGDIAAENHPLHFTLTDESSIDYFDFPIKKSDVGPGWQLVELGSVEITRVAVEHYLVLSMFGEIPDPPGLIHSRWVADDLEIDPPPPEPEPEPPLGEEDLVKLNEILHALMDSCNTIKVANGYDLDVNEVVEGPVRVPDGVNYWPSVQVMFPDEIKIPHARGRVSVDAKFVIWAACKRSDVSESPGQECIEVVGAVERATQLFQNGQFLSLGYVTNVFTEGSVSDDYPPEIAKDVHVRATTVVVTYHHDRRNP